MEEESTVPDECRLRLAGSVESQTPVGDLDEAVDSSLRRGGGDSAEGDSAEVESAGAIVGYKSNRDRIT